MPNQITSTGCTMDSFLSGSTVTFRLHWITDPTPIIDTKETL